MMDKSPKIKGKILVIDDTVSVINMVKTALLKADYQVLIATSGNSGIVSASLAQPDLILLDILMPEIDGYETCQLLKQDDKTKDIPVLFMSALNEVFDKVKAFQMGAVDYVTKPLNVDELLARVNTQVKIYQLQKQLENTNEQLEERVEERTAQLKAKNFELEQKNAELLAAEEELKTNNEELKISFEKLSESEEKAQKYLNIAGVVFVALDTSGMVTLVNQKGGEILGYNIDEIVGINWFDNFIPKNTREEARNNFLELMDGRIESGVYSESSIVTKNNEVRIIAWNNSVLLGNRGEIIGILLSGEDITLRKLAEQELQNEKLFTDIALDAQADTFFLFEPETGKAIRWNKAFSDVSGYSNEEIATLPAPVSYYSSRDIDRASAFMKDVIEKGFGIIELELVCKDGTTIPTEYSVSTINDKQGEVRFLISIGRDITERRKAESKLKQSEEKFRSYIKSAPIGVFVVDEQSNFIDVNASGEEITGYEKSELLKMKLSQIVAPDDKEKNIAEFENVAKSGKTSSELGFINKEGGLCYWQMDTVKLSNTRFLSFATDITQRKLNDNIKAAHIRLVEFAATHNTNQLLEQFLNEAEVLTNSNIGFYHFFDDDEETISLQAWSDNTFKNSCNAKVGSLHFPLSEAGVWTDCVKERKPVIHNNYKSLSHKKGLPEGHVEVIRELVVPVIRSKKIVAVLGVGNKPNDYTEQDVKVIQQLADLAWETVIRKQAEESLLKEKNRAESIIEGTNAGTWDWNVHTKELEINERWTEIFGYTKEELSPITIDTWRDSVYPTDLEIADEILKCHINKEIDYYDVVFRQKHKNGSWVWVNARGKIVEWTDEGQPARITGTHLDITKRKKVEIELKKHQEELELIVRERTEELEASNAELIATNDALYDQKEKLEATVKELNKTQNQLIQSEKMASLGVLVAGVAHEINNPVNFINSSLTGLKNNLEYLNSYARLYNQLYENTTEVIEQIKEKEKEASVSEVIEMFRRSIEIIEVGIERTTKIVKGLKAFARSDEKKLDMYDIHENIDNTLLILYNQFKNRIEIIKEFGEVPQIECFPGQINQVLMNILNNAVQAIPDEGKITISTSANENGHVSIKVKDNGKGIEKKLLKHIFDPFFTTKDVGKGTGLGLSISYGIIEDHNGKILVESEPDKGSCFKILLPIRQTQ